METIEQSIKDNKLYKRCQKIIASCKTKEQKEIAEQYCFLAGKKTMKNKKENNFIELAHAFFSLNKT